MHGSSRASNRRCAESLRWFSLRRRQAHVVDGDDANEDAHGVGDPEVQVRSCERNSLMAVVESSVAFSAMNRRSIRSETSFDGRCSSNSRMRMSSIRCP